MCFLKDYDYVFEDWHEGEGVTAARDRCDECRCVIWPGEWRKCMEGQQYESCRNRAHYDGLTDDDEIDVFTDGHGDVEEGDCDYGERYEYVRCERCDAVLKAIQAHEVEEGCVGDSTTPYLEQLSDAVTDADEAEFDAYAAKLRAIAPQFSHQLDRLSRSTPSHEWGPRDLEPMDEIGGEG